VAAEICLDVFNATAQNTASQFNQENLAMRIYSFAVLVSVLVGTSRAAEFAAPVRLEAGGEAVRVESPGYACPCWVDVDKDGKKDLVVGQFAQGKIRIFKSLGDNKFTAGEWLQVDGKPAEVPGVW
jgi:hypothetical protein